MGSESYRSKETLVFESVNRHQYLYVIFVLLLREISHTEEIHKHRESRITGPHLPPSEYPREVLNSMRLSKWPTESAFISYIRLKTIIKPIVVRYHTSVVNVISAFSRKTNL